MTQSVSPSSCTSCTSHDFPESSECIDPPQAKNLCDQPEAENEPAASTLPGGPGARASPRALRFCVEADTVIEGFLCSEPTVVSNACRDPKNAFDVYVCDEPRMHALQKSIAMETLSMLKTLLLRLIGPRG